MSLDYALMVHETGMFGFVPSCLVQKIMEQGANDMHMIGMETGCRKMQRLMTKTKHLGSDSQL